MRTKVRPIGESSLAVRTFVRFLSRVGSNMPLKKPRSTERFAANFTLAGQRVRSDVHFKRS